MGLYNVPLSMSLLDFVMGTILANFQMGGIMLVLRAVFNMRVQEGLCVLGACCLICHGRILCGSQVLPYPLLHSLTMSFMVFQLIFFLQL